MRLKELMLSALVFALVGIYAGRDLTRLVFGTLLATPKIIACANKACFRSWPIRLLFGLIWIGGNETPHSAQCGKTTSVFLNAFHDLSSPAR